MKYMHHTLRFYSRNRSAILRFYMLGGAMTRIPVVGRLVRYIANVFGEKGEGAFLLTPAQAEAIIEKACGVAVGPCACRSFNSKATPQINTEILIGESRKIFEHDQQDTREITKDEARRIIRDAHSRGLIQTLIHCRHQYYALCNCCPCCCVPLRLKKQYGIGNALRAQKYLVDRPV